MKKKIEPSPTAVTRKAVLPRENLRMRESRKPSLSVNTSGEKVTFTIPNQGGRDQSSINGKDSNESVMGTRRVTVLRSPSRYANLSPRRSFRPPTVNFADAGSYNKEILEQRVKQEVDKRCVYLKYSTQMPYVCDPIQNHSHTMQRPLCRTPTTK